MDSSNEKLHPNWRALATVDLRLKRFVAEGTFSNNASGHQPRKKHSIQNICGEEASNFYNEIVKSNSIESNNSQKSSARHSTVAKRNANKNNNNKEAAPFDCKNYFRFAMENNCTELVKLDLKSNEINACDSYGWTALMMAACEGATDAVKLLLQRGIDKHIKDKAGFSAVDYARRKGFLPIVRLLETDEMLPQISNIQKKRSPPRLTPFFCELCRQEFAESTLQEHETSTLHQFNEKPTLPENKLNKFNISAKNRGLQLMVKQGWDKESGLGPNLNGRLYPLKTVLRKERTGLGIEQESARVTHFDAFDARATERRKSNYYKSKARTRNDIKREKKLDWKRERRLRKELS